LILYSVCDSVMHLCPFCNRRTINLLDDDDDDDRPLPDADVDSAASFLGYLHIVSQYTVRLMTPGTPSLAAS